MSGDESSECACMKERTGKPGRETSDEDERDGERGLLHVRERRGSARTHDAINLARVRSLLECTSRAPEATSSATSAARGRRQKASRLRRERPAQQDEEEKEGVKAVSQGGSLDCSASSVRLLTTFGVDWYAAEAVQRQRGRRCSMD